MAKEKDSNVSAGQTVELADKDTGFSDPVTGFKIVREQQVQLGDTIGRKTNKALLSGALLVVGGKSKAKPADKADDKTEGK